MEAAHKKLASENADSGDWQWCWLGIEPKHYSECSLYSVLIHERDEKHLGEDIIELKPNFYGLGINLNAIWRKLKLFGKK